MSGAFGSYHEHIHITGRNDLSIVDVKAVSKYQALTGLQVGSNALLIQFGLFFVVDENHDNICLLSGLSSGCHLETCFLGELPGFAAFI